MTDIKTGLVLEGGGLRAMYTAGVLDAFLDRDVTFDVGVGVSAGAAYGISYISKQKGRNMEICEKFLHDKRYLSKRNLLREGALFGQTFVYEIIPKYLIPFDYKTYFSSSTKFLTGVTNIETGLPEYYELKDDKYKFDLFKATCALPLVAPIVKLAKGLYLDGGLSDPIPYKKALEEGCDKLVIILTRHRGYVKQEQRFLKFIKFFYRKYPKVYELLKERHELYNKQIEEVEALQKEGKAVIIRPKRPMKIDRIEKNLRKIRKLYNMGLRDGEKVELDMFGYAKRYFI